MRRKASKPHLFRSRKEEAQYWETHSVGEHWKNLENVDELLVLNPDLVRRIRVRAKKRLLTLRIEQWQIDQARRIARQRKEPYQALLRRWIAEGVRRDR